ncbi:MAG: mechanosensitive ion channel family protein, partial [Candidatus Fimimorpha sp.]
REGKRRIELEIGISYGSDLKKAKQIMEQVIKGENHLEDPPVQVFIGDLKDSAIIVKAFFWTTVDDYWPVLRDIKEKVKDAYDEAGITIPFPQMDVHFHTKIEQ